MNRNNDNTTDFELAVAGHSGDRDAADTLWRRYRLMMVGMLRKYNNSLYQLSQGEMESEAAEIFMHVLKEVFTSEKVMQSPAEWNFSYLLAGGMKNHRSKLIAAKWGIEKS